MDVLSAIAIAVFMATVAERLTAALVVPVWDKLGWDKFYLMYPSWLIGSLLVALTGANVFGAYVPDPLAGQVLTAIVAGGGANLLHDLFDKPELPVVELATIEQTEPGAGLKS